ncbi:MAG: glycerate kinase, partial [Actinomycetota bacterium]|nr:glycerate kinase [Actinomycetota bacterium]
AWGIGGSACTDGGAGMLQALGAWLSDQTGAELSGRPADVRHPWAVAAGGVGYAALAVLKAQSRPGLDVVLDQVNFSGRLVGAARDHRGDASPSRL